MPIFRVHLGLVRSPVAKSFPVSFPYHAYYNRRNGFVLKAHVKAASAKAALNKALKEFDPILDLKYPVSVLQYDSDLKPVVPEWWDVDKWKLKKVEYAYYVNNPIKYKMTPYQRLEGRVNLLIDQVKKELETLTENKATPSPLIDIINNLPKYERGTITLKEFSHTLEVVADEILEKALLLPHSFSCSIETGCDRCRAELLYNLPLTALPTDEVREKMKEVIRKNILSKPKLPKKRFPV